MLHDKIEFFKVLDWPEGVQGDYLTDEIIDILIESDNNQIGGKNKCITLTQE